jgi:hypothetical protein
MYITYTILVLTNYIFQAKINTIIYELLDLTHHTLPNSTLSLDLHIDDFKDVVMLKLFNILVSYQRLSADNKGCYLANNHITFEVYHHNCWHLDSAIHICNACHQKLTTHEALITCNKYLACDDIFADFVSYLKHTNYSLVEYSVDLCGVRHLSLVAHTEKTSLWHSSYGHTRAVLCNLQSLWSK